MANKKMKKLIAALAVLAMVATLVPTMVFASNTVSVEATLSYVDGEPNINVEGSISGAGDITLLVLRSAESLDGVIPAQLNKDAIMYIDQKTAENGSASWKVLLRDNDVEGDYITVFVGGTDVDSYVSTELVLESAAAITADDIEIINADGDPVYSDYLEDDNVIVAINTDAVDPETQKIVIGSAEAYYVLSRNYFIAIVPAADAETIAAAAEIAAEASDEIVYGKNPASDEPSEPLDGADFNQVKKLVLGKIAAPTAKELLSADVGGGAMDGVIDGADLNAIKRVVLEKDADLAINAAE